MGRRAYYNGTIYTCDPKHPSAQAFIVEDGRFVCVGSNDDIKDCAEKTDLEGRCVIPGLIDSHCHMFAGVAQAAANMQAIDPKTKPSELGDVLKSVIEEDPEDTGEVLVAYGLDITLGTYSAGDIDRAVNDRPVIVLSHDGHALLLNSRAMEEFGVDKDIEDPGEGSYFARDDDGDPTGLVIEIPAMRKCTALLSELLTGDSYEPLKLIAGSYSALGYTGLFEAMSVNDDTDDILASLKRLDEDGNLPLRLSLSFCYNGENAIGIDEAIRIMKDNRDRFTSENVKPDTLKMIPDGTIEEHSALLSSPYSDETGGFGSRLLSYDEMKKAASLAAGEGFSIHIHAIGDKAVNEAVSVLTSLGPTEGTRTIAHNQLYSDDDIKRIIKDKNIFFQTTPHWMKGDEHTFKCLGENRYDSQFPVGTMVRNGVCVTFGSDSCLDLETSNAFLGMYYACTRGDKALLKDKALPPSLESITREQALYAYTINCARQLGIADETGSISVGKSADFIILDRDIIKCPINDLIETEVLKAFFRGKDQVPD